MVLRGRSSLHLAVCGPLRPEQLPSLCAEVSDLLESSGAHSVRCDVGESVADAVTVDALARIALVARRRHCSFRLHGASRPLRELISLMGLDEILHE